MFSHCGRHTHSEVFAVLIYSHPKEAEGSIAYQQPSCSPSDPADTCWTAAHRACSPRRWEPTSCLGSDRRQMSKPPGTSKRWAGWYPADATLDSWSYRGSSGLFGTETPSAPWWWENRSLEWEQYTINCHHYDHMQGKISTDDGRCHPYVFLLCCR